MSFVQICSIPIQYSSPCSSPFPLQSLVLLPAWDPHLWSEELKMRWRASSSWKQKRKPGSQLANCVVCCSAHVDYCSISTVHILSFFLLEFYAWTTASSRSPEALRAEVLLFCFCNVMSNQTKHWVDLPSICSHKAGRNSPLCHECSYCESCVCSVLFWFGMQTIQIFTELWTNGICKQL